MSDITDLIDIIFRSLSLGVGIGLVYYAQQIVESLDNIGDAIDGLGDKGDGDDPECEPKPDPSGIPILYADELDDIA